MTNNIANISGSDNDLKNACDVMRKGGIILYPTDTVWGIGCDATNPSAIAKFYKLKQRCDSKALIVLLGDENQLHRYVDNIPDIAYELIDVAVKPLTIIYDDAIGLASNLIASDEMESALIPLNEQQKKIQ